MEIWDTYPLWSHGWDIIEVLLVVLTGAVGVGLSHSGWGHHLSDHSRERDKQSGLLSKKTTPGPQQCSRQMLCITNCKHTARPATHLLDFRTSVLDLRCFACFSFQVLKWPGITVSECSWGRRTLTAERHPPCFRLFVENLAHRNLAQQSKEGPFIRKFTLKTARLCNLC